MYNNNPYNSYYGGYQPNYNYQQPTYNYQQPVQKQDMPFSDVRYGTLDEAKAFIVMPAKSVMIINKNMGEFYIKTADSMGNSALETFKYTKIDNNPTQPQTSEFNPKEYVKISDLNEFSKNFLTREDLKLFNDKINELKGDANNGNNTNN